MKRLGASSAILLSVFGFAASASALSYPEKTVHSFLPAPFGDNPTAPLILARDGNQYGTTFEGSPMGQGVVFRIANPAISPVLEVIHAFSGGDDGSRPLAGLIQVSDGSLYGTTMRGGSNNSGTVFKIGDLSGTPTENVLYSFTGGADGGNPATSLIQASDGNLYGTTEYGGAFSSGTVFKISNLSGVPTESVVYSFSGRQDGRDPSASLIQASDGNLYGTAQYGGARSQGVVFRISDFATTPAETVIYSFSGGADGGDPQAALVQTSDGSLYGTTAQGGTAGWGTVFRITNPSGRSSETVIHNFVGGTDGAMPESSLIEASDGNLYGTTLNGGAKNFGTVFRIDYLSDIPAESVVYSFLGGVDGFGSFASLLQTPNGELFGTTGDGGSDSPGSGGAVFKIAGLPDHVTESTIFTFSAGADGYDPITSLVQAYDGNLYGTTLLGGAYGRGSVFRIRDPFETPVESLVYSFMGGEDGSGPSALIQASDGNLYGTTYSGGSSQQGSVFKISDLSGTPRESVVYSFSGGPDGGNPNAPVIQASDGNLYGTTTSGGLYECVISGGGCGTVFKITNLSGTPTESVVYAFSSGTDGAVPRTALVQSSDRSLYGTTDQGGIDNCTTFQQNPIGCGTIFRISNLSASPTESVVYRFTKGFDWIATGASLIAASDGNLYGATILGGALDEGAIFMIKNPSTSPSFSLIHSFAAADGEATPLSLMQASDGAFYGTAGGGQGTIFKITNPRTLPDESIVYSFPAGGEAGAFPSAPLIQASDGRLYGTTALGGTAGAGVVFSIDPELRQPRARIAPIIPANPDPIRGPRDPSPPSR